MIAPIDFNIDEEKEFEFYEELFKLYKENHAFFSNINLDDSLIKLTENAVNSTDVRTEDVFTNVRSFMLQQRSKKEMYKLIAKESNVDFYNAQQMISIAFISNLHFLREPFVGKGNSLEFKFLLVQISQLIGSLVNGINDGINLSAGVFFQKVAIVESMKPLILNEFNDIDAQGILDGLSTYIYDDGFKLSVIDEDANSLDYFIVSEDAIIHAVINEKGLYYDYYSPEKNLEELKLEDLKKYQSVYIQREVIDLIKTYSENDEWKEKIDMNKVEIISPLDINEEQEIVEPKNSLENGIFKQIEELFLPLIKLSPKKEDEIYYRDLIISNIFNSLQEQYSKLNVSDHLLKNITGMFCANLGLLKSEDEHLDGPSYISYTNYLRKTVENVLNKVAFLNS